tara:strand:+ start:251 stop:862 length:612 start_codon:yes stop_codon:yes gene_type:complete
MSSRETIKEYVVEVLEKNTTNLLSEGLRFHINENIPISTNIYRPGSQKYFSLFNEARSLYNAGKIDLHHDIDKMYIKELDIGEWAEYNGQMVPLDYPMLIEESLYEAKYKGKEVKLGKAGARRVKGKKGRAEVFVKDKKTKKIKRVEFGSEMPMAMGSSEEHKNRRKSFGDRHQCSKKKDKTKAGYWSCRATKLFGRNIPGWW